MKLSQVIVLAGFGVLVTLVTASLAADCKTKPCKNGSCKDDTKVTAGYVCTCYKGFDGTTCDKEIDECKVNQGVCKNNATCLDAIGYYLCACADGWKGENCTDRNIPMPCNPNPCWRGKKCTVMWKTDFKCDCGIFWRGKQCEKHDVALVILICTIIIVVLSIVFVLCALCRDYIKHHPEQFNKFRDSD